MATQIIPIERVLAEFDRLKAQCYEFSDPELCILVAANFCLPVDLVIDLVKKQTPVDA